MSSEAALSSASVTIAAVFLFRFIILTWQISVFAEGMNEDGSFIGKYGRKQQPTNNQAFATLV